MCNHDGATSTTQKTDLSNQIAEMMKRIVNMLVSWAVLSYSAGAVLPVFAATEIKLLERVVPHSSVVRLGDVAEISSADRQQARRLALLPLMPAPAQGTERYLRTREIQDMLSAQNVELGELRFSGAEQVAIGATDGKDNSGGNNNPTNVIRPAMNRHAAILAGASSDRQPVARLDAMRASEIRQQLLSIVENYLNSKTGKVEPWHIECELGERELARLDAAVSAPVCSGGNEPWTGRQRFIVSFSTAAGPVQVPIFADVVPPPVPAVVAVRPIARGDVIKAADIELRTVDPVSKTRGQRWPPNRWISLSAWKHANRFKRATCCWPTRCKRRFW